MEFQIHALILELGVAKYKDYGMKLINSRCGSLG
jgi:hypothetical protein